MRISWIAVGAMLLIGACGPGPQSGGNPGGGSSESGSATIDLTVSGDLSGSSKQLAKADCADKSLAVPMKTFVVELYPVIDGTTYDVFMQIKQYAGGAVSLKLPADTDRLMLVFSAKGTSGVAWLNVSETSGAVTVSQDLASGQVDLKSLETTSLTSKIDLAFTYRCPPST